MAEDGKFITTDLVLSGRFPLGPLFDALQASGLLSMSEIERRGGVSKVRLGLARFRGTPDQDIKSLATIIEGLDPDRRAEWNRLICREFDFGFDSPSTRFCVMSSLSNASLAKIASIGGSIAISIYRAVGEDQSPEA